MPEVLVLMVAGGLGVYSGSIISPKVDMPLFRRILIFLLLLGANVMLFAGQPGRLAFVGVISIMGGVILYILALWNQPVFPFMKGSGGLSQRWLGNMVYSSVATNDDDEDFDGLHQERAEVGVLDEGEGEGNKEKVQEQI